MTIGNNNTETSEGEMLNNIVFTSATKNGSNADAYISRFKNFATINPNSRWAFFILQTCLRVLMRVTDVGHEGTCN